MIINEKIKIPVKVSLQFSLRGRKNHYLYTGHKKELDQAYSNSSLFLFIPAFYWNAKSSFPSTTKPPI